MSSLLNSFRTKIGRLVDRDVLNSEFKTVIIDSEALDKTRRYSSRYRCSQRLSKGLFYTDKERQAAHSRMSRVKLP